MCQSLVCETQARFIGDIWQNPEKTKAIVLISCRHFVIFALAKLALFRRDFKALSKKDYDFQGAFNGELRCFKNKTEKNSVQDREP